jgi:hypothetical protein
LFGRGVACCRLLLTHGLVGCRSQGSGLDGRVIRRGGFVAAESGRAIRRGRGGT